MNNPENDPVHNDNDENDAEEYNDEDDPVHYDADENDAGLNDADENDPVCNDDDEDDAGQSDADNDKRMTILSFMFTNRGRYDDDLFMT